VLIDVAIPGTPLGLGTKSNSEKQGRLYEINQRKVNERTGRPITSLTVQLTLLTIIAENYLTKIRSLIMKRL